MKQTEQLQYNTCQTTLRNNKNVSISSLRICDSLWKWWRLLVHHFKSAWHFWQLFWLTLPAVNRGMTLSAFQTWVWWGLSLYEYPNHSTSAWLAVKHVARVLVDQLAGLLRVTLQKTQDRKYVLMMQQLPSLKWFPRRACVRTFRFSSSSQHLTNEI